MPGVLILPLRLVPRNATAITLRFIGISPRGLTKTNSCSSSEAVTLLTWNFGVGS
jgi:hypothetical protein